MINNELHIFPVTIRYVEPKPPQPQSTTQSGKKERSNRLSEEEKRQRKKELNRRYYLNNIEKYRELERKRSEQARQKVTTARAVTNRLQPGQAIFRPVPPPAR